MVTNQTREAETGLGYDYDIAFDYGIQAETTEDTTDPNTGSAPRVLANRRQVATVPRVQTAERVLGGSVSGGGDEPAADYSLAQALARVGHSAGTIEREANVTSSVAQMNERRQGDTR